MDFLEYQGKAVLAEAGLPTPAGRYCETVDEVVAAVQELGPCAVKAQVPTGKRGKAGGIRLVANAQEAAAAAADILALTIGGHEVAGLLVEQQIKIARELYAAVMNDLSARTPLLLFSTQGGMDIEEVAANNPEAICRIPVPMDGTLDTARLEQALAALDLDDALRPSVVRFLQRLHALYLEKDLELLEINPLAVLEDGTLVALDCKLTVDDSALFRQPDLAGRGAPERRTELEERGVQNGLKYIELDGNVGVLANGAGLTMTTMDVISHFGGSPANFLEIGGDAYTKGEAALQLVLADPKVKSLVINFCGAFARTDVMTEGIVAAWEVLKPEIPVFFSVHGTGEDRAVEILESRLGVTPHDRMEDAVAAAVEAAQ
ncbi:MAG: ATP-grasp domain-containing protein [Ottowia sp.]|nr:acetate--CoA ligase family protein [Ottowia sp.]